MDVERIDWWVKRDDLHGENQYQKTISNMLNNGVLKPICNPCWFCGEETFVITFREVSKNQYAWMAHCEKH